MRRDGVFFRLASSLRWVRMLVNSGESLVNRDPLRIEHMNRRLVTLLRLMVGQSTCSRHPGYGYRWDESGRRVPDEAERATIALIAELRGAGMTWKAIAAELGRRGILTSAGRPWSHDRVTRAYRAADYPHSDFRPIQPA